MKTKIIIFDAVQIVCLSIVLLNSWTSLYCWTIDLFTFRQSRVQNYLGWEFTGAPGKVVFPKVDKTTKKINYNNLNYIDYWIIFFLPKIDRPKKNIKLVLSKNHTYKPKQVIEVKYQIIWNYMAATNMEDIWFVQPGQYAWNADRFPGASNLVASDS